MNAAVARNRRDTTSHILDDPVQGQIDSIQNNLAGFGGRFKLVDGTETAPPFSISLAPWFVSVLVMSVMELLVQWPRESSD